MNTKLLQDLIAQGYSDEEIKMKLKSMEDQYDEADSANPVTPQSAIDRLVKAIDHVEDEAKTNASNVTHTANAGFKGEHSTPADLPTTGNVDGDYAFVGTKGSWQEYGYTGTAWELVGPAPSGGANAIDDSRLLNSPTGQGNRALSAGPSAGQSHQGQQSVAVGYEAGRTSQSGYSVAVGSSAGETNQGTFSVAIGTSAGDNSQGDYAVAIGSHAGQTSQKDYSVAIGPYAGYSSQPAKSIIMGAGASSWSHAIKADKEGDIVLETVTTSNNNNNRVVISDGAMTINGVAVGGGGASGSTRHFKIAHTGTVVTDVDTGTIVTSGLSATDLSTLCKIDGSVGNISKALVISTDNYFTIGASNTKPADYQKAGAFTIVNGLAQSGLYISKGRDHLSADGAVLDNTVKWEIHTDSYTEASATMDIFLTLLK